MCRMKMVPVFSTDDTHKLDNNNECYETVHLNETELDKKSSFLKNDLFNIKVNMDSIDNNCPKMLNWEFYTYIFFMIYSAICSLLFLSFTFSNINTLSCLVESSTDTSNEIAYEKTILMIYQVTLTLYGIISIAVPGGKCNTGPTSEWGEASFNNHSGPKNHLISKPSMMVVPEIKLIRTDTTL